MSEHDACLKNIERIRLAHGCTKAPTVDEDVGAIIETHRFVLGRNALLEDRCRANERKFMRVGRLIDAWRSESDNQENPEDVRFRYLSRVIELQEAMEWKL